MRHSEIRGRKDPLGHMFYSPASKHQGCPLGLSSGLAKPSYFRSQPVISDAASRGSDSV